MHISEIIKRCLLLLICQRVSFSRHIFSKNETFPKENFDNAIEKFFVDLNMAYLQKYQPQHVTVIGASANEFKLTQPLFENYPHIICKELEMCTYSPQFSQGSIVIVFLRDLSEETFGKNIKILSQCRKCKVLFVSNGIIRVNDIWLIFTLAMKHNVPYSEFVHFGKKAVKLYSDFVATNCSMEVRLVTVWRPGVGLDKIKMWTSRPRDMNGCPVSISSLTFTPKMMIEENENGSLTIVDGREGKLVLVLAKELNFTIALRYPSIENQLKYSRKESILNDVVSGISEIGIGRLRPTNHLNNSIAASFWYDEECVTWGVPRVMNCADDIVWVEFSWEVWVWIGLVFTISCIVKYVHENVVTSKNGQEKNLGSTTIFLDAIANHLGHPAVYLSRSAGGRLMLLACLYYAMVIATAYKTSLASILTTNECTSAIVNEEGILNANFNLGGSLYDYNILKDQINASELIPKLLERFDVNNNDSVTWEQLMFDRDFAYLARRSSLDYERQMILKANESVAYDVLNGCVLAYPTVMVFQKKSSLRKSVDNIIGRLVESGILRHWDIDELDADTILKRKSAEKYFEERASYKFRNIFILYFFCIAVSLSAFFIELLTRKFNLKKRR